MKGVKRVVNAIINAEMQNLENKDYAENIDNYCIVTNVGFFWGHLPQHRIDVIKAKQNECDKA